MGPGLEGFSFHACARAAAHRIDAVGKYDFPVAVNEVLEEKGAKNLQIMVHCVSSVTFFMSMLSGQLEGKIRSVLASKVAFCTVHQK